VFLFIVVVVVVIFFLMFACVCDGEFVFVDLCECVFLSGGGGDRDLKDDDLNWMFKSVNVCESYCFFD